MLLAPVIAVAFAACCAAGILLLIGASPIDALQAMLTNALSPTSSGIIVNATATYYLAAVAAAVAFRIGLFNIGTEGQYKIAAFIAGAVGGLGILPGIANDVLIIAVAILVGAAWAGIAAVLRVWRGVSEVISTIALNFVALGLISYLLLPTVLGTESNGSIGTKPIAPESLLPGWTLAAQGASVWGLVPLAVVIGIAFAILMERSVLGFEFRATGMSATAATFAGASSKRMIITSMLISGGVAGLIGIPTLLGTTGSYTLSFPTGLGFIGVAVALLGRNRAGGMVVAALLFAFLDNSSNVLQLQGVNAEIVRIMEGIIVLAVLVATRIARRLALAAQTRAVRAASGPLEVVK
ncbi:ABC transporter permease [Agreia pratensis]|nr:ABC transporter permease [Microbacterium sp. VKM Ac-2870]MBF4633885.1 ABC transporter permease [Agreia pratensis]